MTDDSLEQALKALRDERMAVLEHPDPRFAGYLADLQRWQSEHVAAFHRARAKDHNGEALLDFLTRVFYLEADWSELIEQPERAARVITRIVTNDSALVVALRLQATADSLDRAVAEALLADGAKLDAYSYVRAFRRVGRVEERERQIRWIGMLVDLLGRYSRLRTANWVFKIAGRPARSLGVGQTHELLAQGFAAMRQTRDLEGATREAVAQQRRRLDRLLP